MNKGIYFMQTISGDIVLTEETYDSEDQAVRAAKRIERSPFTEGDRVRVLDLHFDLVYENDF